MENIYYILQEDKTPISVDFETWALWARQGNRRIAEDQIEPGVCVSTVFLGIDHSHVGPPPILFETMIFGGEHDGYQKRCCTWAEAEEMHKKACDLVRNKGSIG